ncbi:MAG TPA: TrkA C-terminal domain-containing protein, partial [Thermomicrobiales bacterium]|nr:TrkA C-terminal domain-containing protein [Thermomicrobiales bacterium]
TRSPAHRIRMSFPLLSALSVRDAMRPQAASINEPVEGQITVEESASLGDALQQLAEAEATHAVVVDCGEPVGELTNRDALAAYKNMLQRGVRRARAMPASSLIVEGTLHPGSPLAGKSLRDAALPSGTLVVSILRGRETVFPTADTILQPDDVVTSVAPPDSVGRMHQLMEG